MEHREVTLDDKYDLVEGKAYMTGIQALVRLPLDQKRLDLQAGHNTAGFISGYRGSPLGGYDQQLRAAQKWLDAHDVKFWEGLNEDLGATAVWGSQQLGLFPGAQRDGLFGIWYGKAPGVDRTGDVFKHANAAGTSPLGGVLAVLGVTSHRIVKGTPFTPILKHKRIGRPEYRVLPGTGRVIPVEQPVS